jgi:flagellin
MLQRVRELAVQYKNGTLSVDDRTAIQSEVNQLESEINRIGQQVEFNGVDLLSTAGSITFQVGAMDNETITVSTVSLGAAVGTLAFAMTATGVSDINEIDTAINNVSAQRAQFGAVQNRLDHTLANLATYHENLVASESRIRDADMASEMVNFTKLQILQQAGTSMLAQANQVPQSVLTLLRG